MPAVAARRSVTHGSVDATSPIHIAAVGSADTVGGDANPPVGIRYPRALLLACAAHDGACAHTVPYTDGEPGLDRAQQPERAAAARGAGGVPARVRIAD